jgi:arylsulfatase A-like enzyme
VTNEIVSPHGLAPDLLAAAGDDDIKDQPQERRSLVGGRTYKVHLDGYNILPAAQGETDESPRRRSSTWTDDGDLTALRYNNWKMVFLEQRGRICSNRVRPCFFDQAETRLENGSCKPANPSTNSAPGSARASSASGR